jgi:hypothetical protein
MMGGEGSSTLAGAQRMMGAKYLGCYTPRMMGGMMNTIGPGMMGRVFDTEMMQWARSGAWDGHYGMMNFGIGAFLMC